ncbi:RraA family protein [Rhodococcus erythropolis]|uniref:RraA family protein n=1 Tax=Rhodococcus erythropolis TaxID=1833 RepID=UPI003D121147
MESVQLQRTYLDLTTPHIADACMRLDIPVRCAPPSIRPLWADTHVVGRVAPVRHHGSVDVFLEAIEGSTPGDVLMVDNGGREDEACVGDLVALEAQRADLSGIAIWGLHRDTSELRTIRLPLFSQGALPTGPQRLDAACSQTLVSARCGLHTSTADDFLVGDDDGLIFIPLDRAADVAELATAIRDTERYQAARMRQGTTFRAQARFDEFLSTRKEQEDFTFRRHLRAIGGAIEE